MAKWIAVVDDDMTNLKLAGHILSKNNMRVSAMTSGKALLHFLQDNKPDLILLDIMMPEMDGFETITKVREQERSLGQEQIPVIFLSADESKDMEGRVLELGASDFIRKPFVPEVLCHRIQSILVNHEKIQSYEEETSIDKLTGLLNKSTVNTKLTEGCKSLSGSLLVADLDSFKQVNDLYGQEMGDKVLVAFAELLRENTSRDDIIGRIGGDEFVIFLKDKWETEEIGKFSRDLNNGLVEECKDLMGEDMNIPIGISIGAVMIPMQGNSYGKLFKMADKALYYVKLNGKHDFAVYQGEESASHEEIESASDNLHYLSKIMEEQGEANCALWVGQDVFTQIYRFMVRYIKSYNGQAYKVLFTVSPKKHEELEHDLYMSRVEEFGDLIKNTLRKSDLMMQSKSNQFFLLLPEVNDWHIDKVIGRILAQWEQHEAAKDVEIIYELEMVTSDEQDDMGRRGAD